MAGEKLPVKGSAAERFWRFSRDFNILSAGAFAVTAVIAPPALATAASIGAGWNGIQAYASEEFRKKSAKKSAPKV